MSRIGKIARRTFLFGSLAIAGGVAFGVYQVRKPAPNPLRPGAGEASLNPFVLIDQQGVTLITPRAEMGQGTQSTLAALIADELDIAWEDVRVLHGPAAKAYFNSALLSEALPNKGYDVSDFQHSIGQMLGQVGKLMNMQITGGSTAMKDGFERMRVAGATAREMLKAAAAERLGVDVGQLRTENGKVIAPDGTELRYPELAEAAADIDPPDIALRQPSDWKYIGKSMPRVDMLPKATGTATFGIDVRPEGLKFASVRMNPRLGGPMKGFDDSAARGMPGVEDVVDLGNGVAVVASNTWLAIQAVNAIEIDWGPAPYPHDMDGIMAAIAAGFDAEPNSTLRDDGDADMVPDGAEVLEAEYQVPFVAHAAMEPMNATALIDADGLTVWCGNQAPTFIQKACADVAGLNPDQVEVHTTYMGGAFGRRGELDFAQIATRVAMAVPGTPVQVTWSREEDMTHDFYRPAYMARMKGAVQNGSAVLLDAAVSGPSTAQQAMGRWLGLPASGPDKEHVSGLFNQPYAIRNYRARGHLADLDIPIGFWRSVGSSYNAFFMESFIDEMAVKAGTDPLEFRLRLARPEHGPSAEVLEAVRDMSGWTGETPDGVGRGVAFCYSFGTPTAQVIEVLDDDGQIRINRAWIAADVGVALDPSIIEAQLVGGMIYGLSAAVMEEITFADGMVEQTNFYDHDALRISAIPKTEVRILENSEHISGIGEPGTPPAAPALANAIFDLTGQRARNLPLQKMFDFVL